MIYWRRNEYQMNERLGFLVKGKPNTANFNPLTAKKIEPLMRRAC